jgi:hypothetical protein
MRAGCHPDALRAFLLEQVCSILLEIHSLQNCLPTLAGLIRAGCHPDALRAFLLEQVQ